MAREFNKQEIINNVITALSNLLSSLNDVVIIKDSNVIVQDVFTRSNVKHLRLSVDLLIADPEQETPDDHDTR